MRRRLGPGPRAETLLGHFRNDPSPVCLIGRWAGGGALIASAPLEWAGERVDDPFAVMTRLPPAHGGAAGAVGGGWFGWLGYQLGGRIERLPPSPPRPAPMPALNLAYYDHVLRYDDAERAWWFEALMTPRRRPAIEARFEELRARVAAAPTPTGTYDCGAFVMEPDPSDHVLAVERARAHIFAGDIFQANVCARLEAGFTGDPMDLFVHGVRRLRPAYAAFVASPDGRAVASFSPELFLRRQGRFVHTSPVKGTGPTAEAVRASAKDNAENVMIVDVCRNDLGRVCVPGSVRVPALARPEPHPGLWHLVSDVVGELRADADDRALLRATFPPASVTGAPKIRAMELIAALERSGREVYTGAIGYASPWALELNVAIRTFEFASGRVWLGVGGGVVADSEARSELDECFVKARPLLDAVTAPSCSPSAPSLVI